MIWLILIAAIVIVVIIRPYILKYDTVLAFTGGLGSGKSFLSVITALRLLRRSRVKTRVYNLFHPRSRLPLPTLYSNIPIKISRKEYSTVLTDKVLTLQESIIKGSIVLLDEVDGFANQFAWENPNISKLVKYDKNTKEYNVTSGLFDDFCRFFRHYYASPVAEPHLILNTQAVGNINLAIRRRMNVVYTLSSFKIYRLPLFLSFLGIYAVNCHRNDMSDETIVNQYSEENERLILGLMPLYRHYDTHCYSGRASKIPLTLENQHTAPKTNVVATCPYTPLNDLQLKENPTTER